MPKLNQEPSARKAATQPRFMSAAVEAELRTIVDEAIASAGVGSKWMRAVDSPLGDQRVRSLVRKGVIPSARPAKHLLIDRVAHDAWIAEHAGSSAPAPTNDTARVHDLIAKLEGMKRGAQ